MTAHKAGHLELPAKPVGSSTGWRISRCLIGLNHFQEAQIVSASFYQLTWSQPFIAFIASGNYYSGWEGQSESCWFQGLPEALSSCLCSCFKNFPTGWNVSISMQTVTQQVGLPISMNSILNSSKIWRGRWGEERMSESLRCVMVPLNNQLDRIYSHLGDGPLGMPLGNCMLIGVGRQGTAL